MPFWKREVQLPAPTDGAPPAPPEGVEVRGNLACSEQGCVRHDAAACGYVDRRRRSCPTAWCPDHQVIVGSRPYCRRHARITAAAASGEFQAVPLLPDLDNRSPSLADYVGDALEPRVLEILNRLRRPGSNDQVVAEPLGVVHPTSGGRRWDRTWKLYDHTGVHAKVSVEVEESRDPEVSVRVGTHVVSRGVPPWIERRRQGLAPLGVPADNDLRERFYSALWRPVLPALLAELERAPFLSY